MGYWDEKRNYEELKEKFEEREERIKTKCPMNKDIEVIWQSTGWPHLKTCSFSGYTTCRRCIDKGGHKKEKRKGFFSKLWK